MPEVQTCTHCGQALTNIVRLSRRYCSDACKMKRYRRRKTIGTEGRYVYDLEQLIGEGATFGTVYADPPWRYGNSATRGNARRHYPTMSIDEITALPVKHLVANQALLWLWSTTAFESDAKEIMGTWGFAYKTSIIWDKGRMGLGNFARLQHEILLLGSRGGQRTLTRSLRSVIQEPRGRHSAKPDLFRRLVEANSPPPRLELFARGTHEGWVSFGNEG